VNEMGPTLRSTSSRRRHIHMLWARQSGLVERQLDGDDSEGDDDAEDSVNDDDSEDDLEDDIRQIFPNLPVQSPAPGGNNLIGTVSTAVPGATSTAAPGPASTSVFRIGAGITASTPASTSSTPTPSSSSAAGDNADADANEEGQPTESTEPTPAESNSAAVSEAPTLPGGAAHSLGAAVAILIGAIGKHSSPRRRALDVNTRESADANDSKPVGLVLLLAGIRFYSRRRRANRKRPRLVPPSSGHDSPRAASMPQTLSSPHPGMKTALAPTWTSSGRSTDWSLFSFEKTKQLDSSSVDSASVRTGSVRGIESRRVSALEKLEGPGAGGGTSKRDSFWPRQYGINMNFDAEMMSPTMTRHPDREGENRNTTTTTASSGILPIGMRI
jgi:hypothetical protein